VTFRKFIVFFWICLIGTAAVAGEEHRTKIEIAVDSENAEHRVFRFDSQDSDVDLHALAIGDSEIITDSDGNEVTVVRTEDGFEFDVEGEKIEIAGMHGEHDVTMLHETHDSDDVVIKKHKQVRMIKSNDAHGITIISGEKIDDETRAALESVLKEAGQDGEILFLDGDELSGDEQAHDVREVHIIRKEIDVTN